MNDELDRVVQRTRQYWFADGLVELSVGGTFIFLGLYFYLQSILPSGSLILFTLQAGFVLLLFGIIFLSRYLVNKFKARLTFPRSGYVSYKRATRNQRILSASVALIIASLNVVLFVTTPLSLSWIPAVTGSIVAVVWLISGVRTGLLRFYLQALISVLLGAALSLLAWETYLSLAVYYSAMGLILIASGGLTLSKYLRQSPPIENETPAG
jgi:hypothetical protein